MTLALFNDYLPVLGAREFESVAEDRGRCSAGTYVRLSGVYVPNVEEVSPGVWNFKGVDLFVALVSRFRRGMKPQICICCGEAIAARGQELSRNPNVCASCSSMADGMEESSVASLSESLPGSAPEDFQPLEKPREVLSPDEEVVLDWSAGQISKRSSALPK